MPAPRPRRPARVDVAGITGRERAALLLLAVAPVAIMPEALDRFVFIKLAVASAAVAVAFLAPARGRLPRAAVLGIAAAGVLLVAGALAGAAPLAQLLGRGPRYEGLPTLAVYAGAAAAGARLLGPQRRPDAARWLLRGLAVAAAAVALVAIFEAAGLRPLSSNVARPGSLLGNASDEGAFAVLAVGPLVAIGLSGRDLLVWLGAASAAVTAVLSASRGALVGLAAVAAVLALARRDPITRRVLAAGVAVLAILVMAIPQVRHRALGESSLAGHTTSGRVLLWQETVRLLADRPLLGVGPNGFEDAVVTHHDRQWQRRVGPADPPDSPHDWVLQAATAGGIPLALLAIVAAAYVARRSRLAIGAEREARAPPLAVGLTAGLCGYLVALLVHLTSPGPTTLAAVFAGALVAQPAVPAVVTRRSLRITVACIAGVLTVFQLMSAIAEIPLRTAVVAVTRGDLAGAKSSFDTAKLLRPWDVEIPLAAGHAFAAASLGGVAGAPAYGRPWLDDALHRVRTSEQAREDLAVVEAASGDLGGAQRLLDEALRRDRFNPELLLRRGVVEAQQHAFAAAEADFRAAASIATRSPEPWQDLATLYTLERRSADAERAREEASRRGG